MKLKPSVSLRVKNREPAPSPATRTVRDRQGITAFIRRRHQGSSLAILAIIEIRNILLRHCLKKHNHVLAPKKINAHGK